MHALIAIKIGEKPIPCFSVILLATVYKIPTGNYRREELEDNSHLRSNYERPFCWKHTAVQNPSVKAK